MLPILRRAALSAAFGLLAVTAAPAQTVKGTFGDWSLRCDTPAGARAEQCAAVQSVAAEDRPNVTLLVIALRTADGRKPVEAKPGAEKPAEDRSRILRVVAPLGILLPAGLGLKIDDQDIGRAGFVRCLASGCVAEVVMDDALVKRLREGKTATFIVFQGPEEGIGIPVSLDGFAQAYDELS